MKRRATASFLAAVLAVGLAACGSSASMQTSETTALTTAPTPTAAAGPVGVNTDADAIASSRRLFAGVTADKPGCTVAVGRDGKVVWAEAFGAADLSFRTPMTTSTVVDIGSTSKQFAATAIALLVQRGLVDIKAPVASYVSGLPKWSKQVTVTQLVHHTSGLADYVDLLVAEGKNKEKPKKFFNKI